jgi:hypothetical protein
VAKPRKRNSFKEALRSAEMRLALAERQRTARRKELSALDVEIPALQQTIAALQKQLGKKGVISHVPGPKQSEQHSVATGGNPSGNETVIPSTIPPEIAKHLVLDLTGMGSIPLKKGSETPQRELTEEELLAEGDVK